MSQTSAVLELISKPALTLTESADDYDSLVKSFERAIKPRGVVEQLYVAEISALVWESLRLRRCKMATINTAFRAALNNLLFQCLKDPDEMAPYQEAEVLAFEWFTDPNDGSQKSSTDSTSTKRPSKPRPSGAWPRISSGSIEC
jgi:hypothetical protein